MYDGMLENRCLWLEITEEGILIVRRNDKTLYLKKVTCSGELNTFTAVM